MGEGDNDILVGDVETLIWNGLDKFGMIVTAGDDDLVGGAADDLLVGDVLSNIGGFITNGGNDRLFGGSGQDTLIGDVYDNQSGVLSIRGHNTFVYDFNINNGPDTILDFSKNNDTLEFRNMPDVNIAAGLSTVELRDLSSVENNSGHVQLNLYSHVNSQGSIGTVQFIGVAFENGFNEIDHYVTGFHFL